MKNLQNRLERSLNNGSEKGSIASRTLSIILLIAIVIIACLYYVQVRKNNQPNIVQSPVVDQVPQTLANEKYGFKITIPSNFTKEETNDAGFFNELGLYELFIRAPADYQTGTDFNIGLIEIIVSSSTAKCYVSSQDGGGLSAIRIINGVEFRYDPAQPFSNAAMGGQRGFGSLFAAKHNGYCYRINQTIGYRDLHGFAEPPYPPHFDEQKVNADFNAIIESFEFTR